MHVSLLQVSLLRDATPEAACTCEHWSYCNCACHDPHCDPSESVCDMVYLADDGGLTPWGCADCTPGQRMPHLLGCELIGWHVPMPGPLGPD